MLFSSKAYKIMSGGLNAQLKRSLLRRRTICTQSSKDNIILTNKRTISTNMEQKHYYGSVVTPLSGYPTFPLRLAHPTRSFSQDTHRFFDLIAFQPPQWTQYPLSPQFSLGSEKAKVRHFVIQQAEKHERYRKNGPIESKHVYITLGILYGLLHVYRGLEISNFIRFRDTIKALEKDGARGLITSHITYIESIESLIDQYKDNDDITSYYKNILAAHEPYHLPQPLPAPGKILSSLSSLSSCTDNNSSTDIPHELWVGQNSNLLLSELPYLLHEEYWDTIRAYVLAASVYKRLSNMYSIWLPFPPLESMLPVLPSNLTLPDGFYDATSDELSLLLHASTLHRLYSLLERLDIYRNTFTDINSRNTSYSNQSNQNSNNNDTIFSHQQSDHYRKLIRDEKAIISFIDHLYKEYMSTYNHIIDQHKITNGTLEIPHITNIILSNDDNTGIHDHIKILQHKNTLRLQKQKNEKEYENSHNNTMLQQQQLSEEHNNNNNNSINIHEPFYSLPFSPASLLKFTLSKTSSASHKIFNTPFSSSSSSSTATTTSSSGSGSFM